MHQSIPAVPIPPPPAGNCGAYLIVNPLIPHLLDHCHLSFAIKANFINRYSLETSAELILTEYNRLFWNIKCKDRLKDGLKSQTVQFRLEAGVKHDSIDIVSELISETLVEACKEARLKARSHKIKCKSQNNWLIRNAKQKKETCNPWGRKFLKTHNSEMRQLLRNKKKRLKQTCRRKKREYISKGMSNIDMQNSKETWRQIGKIFNIGKRKTHGAETVSTEQFSTECDSSQ